MFCLLTCLTLFYALQRSVSSDEVVSLHCASTVNVTAGKNGTISCSINLTFGGKVECTGQKYDWRNTNGTKLCETGSTKYTCAWDAFTYVSLTISNVHEEVDVTVEILSDCGMVKSLPIRVQLISDTVLQTTNPPGPTVGSSRRREESTHVTTTVLCVFASAVVVVILYFLYRTYRRRVSERAVTYTAPGSKDAAVV